jgi:hypothetical protein
MLLVAPAVMMTACAHSPASKPLPRDPDPVVETRTVIERVCPVELAEAPAPLPKRPAGGVLEGDQRTLAWVGAMARAAAELWQQLFDARAACPAPTPAQAK